MTYSFLELKYDHFFFKSIVSCEKAEELVPASFRHDPMQIKHKHTYAIYQHGYLTE